MRPPTCGSVLYVTTARFALQDTDRVTCPARRPHPIEVVGSRGSAFGVVSPRNNSATARSASSAPPARCSTSARRPRASVTSSRAASRACRRATKHSAAEACRGPPLVASPHRSQRVAGAVAGGEVRSAPERRAPRLAARVPPVRCCPRLVDARGFLAMTFREPAHQRQPIKGSRRSEGIMSL